MLKNQLSKYLNRTGKYCFILSMLIAYVHVSYAQNIIVSLPERAGLAEMDENGHPYGSLVTLVKALDEVYLEGEIIILGLYPFKRSIDNVVTGKADFHPVLITSVEPNGFAYSTVRIAVSSSVLYSNANKPPLDHDKLWQYRFDTGRGHADLLHQKFLKDYNKPPLKITEFNLIDQGLKRVASDRTDAIIMEQDSADTVLRRLKLKNIRRELLKQENVHAIIQDSQRGQAIDNILSEAFNELAQQGRLEALSYNIHMPWDDWQPSQMNW